MPVSGSFETLQFPHYCDRSLESQDTPSWGHLRTCAHAPCVCSTRCGLSGTDQALPKENLATMVPFPNSTKNRYAFASCGRRLLYCPKCKCGQEHISAERSIRSRVDLAAIRFGRARARAGPRGFVLSQGPAFLFRTPTCCDNVLSHANVLR